MNDILNKDKQETFENFYILYDLTNDELNKGKFIYKDWVIIKFFKKLLYYYRIY